MNRKKSPRRSGISESASTAGTGTLTAPKPAPQESPPTPPRAPSRTAAASNPTHDQIARRAYELWIAKGRPVGLDALNWREAEQQVLAESR